MVRITRKTTPRVKDGRVHLKNKPPRLRVPRGRPARGRDARARPRTPARGRRGAPARVRGPHPAICDIVADDLALYLYERQVLAQFDRRTAADDTLLHVFLHQLGRHVVALQRGEGSPDAWARRTADIMGNTWTSSP